jgi:hypothetical protein
MTAAGLALIAGGLATLISFWSVIFGGEARRAARDDDARGSVANRRRRAKAESRPSGDPHENMPELDPELPAFPELAPASAGLVPGAVGPAGFPVEAPVFAVEPPLFVPEAPAFAVETPGFALESAGFVPDAGVFVPAADPLPPVPVSRRRGGRRIAEAFTNRPRVVATSPTRGTPRLDYDYEPDIAVTDSDQVDQFVPQALGTTSGYPVEPPAEPVRDIWPLRDADLREDARYADAFNPLAYGRSATPGPRGDVDRSDLGYGDRVEGWVRPEYPELDDRPPAGEYWTPVPDDLYADPEPSARGYGWPVPVERLPQAPSYEPATGFDLTPVEAAEPTAFVPVTWPPDQEERPARQSRSWRDRDDKRYDERRSWREEERRAERVERAESRGRRERPRPRPRPAAQMPGYVSRHSAGPQL